MRNKIDVSIKPHCKKASLIKEITLQNERVTHSESLLHEIDDSLTQEVKVNEQNEENKGENITI